MAKGKEFDVTAIRLRTKMKTIVASVHEWHDEATQCHDSRVFFPVYSKPHMYVSRKKMWLHEWYLFATKKVFGGIECEYHDLMFTEEPERDSAALQVVPTPITRNTDKYKNPSLRRKSLPTTVTEASDEE